MADNRNRSQSPQTPQMNLRMGGPGGPGMRRGAGGPGGPMGARINVEKPKNMKKTLGRLIGYIGKNASLLVMLMISVIVTAAVTLANPALQGIAIDSISEGRMGDLMSALITMAVLFAVSSAMTYIQSIAAAKLSQKTILDMRKDLFKKVSYLPIKFTDTHRHGDIMSRMTNDVDNIAMSVSQSIATLFSGIITLIGAFVMMMYYSPIMTLVAFVTIPITVVVSSALAKLMRKLFVEQQKLLGSLNGEIEEMVTGCKTVMAYGREKSAVDEFSKISRDLRRAGIKANIFGSIMGPIMNAVGNLGFLLVAVVGGHLALSGAITIGVIQSFIQYSKQFTRPINEIANQYSQILTAIAGAERVFEIMDGGQESPEEGRIIDPSDVSGNISFKNVRFAYKEGEPVLQGFDLEVKAGQRIAIVGRTGSGKTTIVNLLNRFYDIDGGAIELDGTDIRELNKQSLRSCIGMVLQDTVLFSDTIGNNIRYGRLDASDTDIREAAHTANADLFIDRLPDGYDTKLSESGSNLSQGQRQLLSIARAVLSDPRILILDEATSNVDTRTEMEIQSAMLNLMKGRTSLIIAHRLSTIRDADMIIVLKDGVIAESGNHEDLLERHGVYYDLYQTQFAGIET